MAISPKLIDQLLEDYQSPSDLLGDDGLFQQLTKALLERTLEGELTHHLGYKKHSKEGRNSGNSRNGSETKTLKGKRGRLRAVAKGLGIPQAERLPTWQAVIGKIESEMKVAANKRPADWLKIEPFYREIPAHLFAIKNA
jgi:hypothetical protein